MRLFVAVFPPAEIQRAAATVIDGLRRAGDGVSWVKPDNLHVTLRFIGEVGEDGARRVAQAAERAARGRPAFDGELGSIGAFPGARRARVLWLGMTAGAAELVALAEALETSLAPMGFDRHAHAFSPHLTIGRVREPRQDWSEALASSAPISGPSRFRVDRLSVVESRLDPKGSIYTVRSEARLAG